MLKETIFGSCPCLPVLLGIFKASSAMLEDGNALPMADLRSAKVEICMLPITTAATLVRLPPLRARLAIYNFLLTAPGFGSPFTTWGRAPRSEEQTSALQS